HLMKMSLAALPPASGGSAKAKPLAGMGVLTLRLVARSHIWKVLPNSVCSKASPGRGKRQKGGQLSPNWGVSAWYRHFESGSLFLSSGQTMRDPVVGSMHEPSRIIFLMLSLEPL